MNERRTTWLVGVAVWLSFLVVSIVSSPIPGVNEPHYLAKAKHYWDPTWCARDQFLDSFPAHQVFYQTFGWLTLWFDFTSVAFVGRVIGSALLAASWTTLMRRFQATSSWSILLSAWMFLGLQAVGNLSGEWLIGGFESKVVSYTFVFWAMAAMLDRRLKAAALCSGVAVSFHPIVGVWHVAALGFTEVTRLASGNLKSETSILKSQTASSLVLLVVSALPGAWPVWQMSQASVGDWSFAANYIQFTYRLKHHLDPMDFGAANYAGYALLAALWLVLLSRLCRKTSLSARDRWFVAYVGASALFALCGFLVGAGERPAELMLGYRWRMALLKFYPFRLFDLMLPLAVAALVARSEWPVLRQRLIWSLATVGFGWAIIAGRVFPPPHPWKANHRADWQDACRWVAANTPADSLFQTPVESDTFKWHAQRAEFVTFKDCPQDAAGIVEWNRRLRFMKHWGESRFANDKRYSADELRELARDTGIDYVVTRRPVKHEADLKFSNRTFKIFRLPK